MKLSRLLMYLIVMLLCIPVYADGFVSAKGKVVDVAGKPLAQISVYAVMKRSEYGPMGEYKEYLSVKDSVESSSDGSFIISNLPIPPKNSVYYLIASSPGRYLGWISGNGSLAALGWSSETEPDSYQITAFKLGDFKGNVTDTNGVGVGGVKIIAKDFMMPHKGSINSHILAKVVSLKPVITDAHGNYTIPEMPDGVKINIAANKTGYANTLSWWNSGVTPLIMPFGGSISGWVYDSHGKPYNGVQITAQGKTVNSTGMIRTAKNGSYKIDGLMQDDYFIIVQDSEKPIEFPDDITVTAGKDTQIPPLTAVDGVEVKGRVIEEKSGKPIPGVHIMFGKLGSTKRWLMMSSKTTRDGSFSSRVIPGEVTYMPDLNDPFYTVSSKMQKVTVSDSGLKDIIIRLPRADSAKGKIVNQSGIPVADAQITVFMGSGPNGTNAFSDKKGLFEVVVPPDTGRSFG